MNGMAYCDLCELDREFCEHGLAEKRRNAAAGASGLLISPSGIAHFSGCPHKGDDRDYSRWAALNVPRAWERLGNGEQLQATGGRRPGLTATDRCRDWSATVRGDLSLPWELPHSSWDNWTFRQDRGDIGSKAVNHHHS